MELSTIVEIILAYQPWIYRVTVTPYLRQQKLYKLISLQVHTHLVYQCIYDSRNYISLLALKDNKLIIDIPSTIVEIILAYQPHAKQKGANTLSTIVEIILAYQPRTQLSRQYYLIYDSRNYISLLALTPRTAEALYIYDSRNYISLLALCSFL